MRVLGSFEEAGASIRGMDSPRSGFRRATIASWALAGIGIAGVAGASTLAYADTLKPQAEAPVEAAIPALGALAPPSAVDLIPTSDVPSPTVDPLPVAAPVTTEAPPQIDIPQQAYEQPPAPVAHEAPTPLITAVPTTKRRAAAPTTVQSPNYSPHVTLSRGS